MNDEQFETIMQQLENHGGRYAMLVLKLRARDTAQREALARVEAERDRWIGNYKHLMEQHMPRTGHGCDEGWSRVVEARELQAQLAEAVGLLSDTAGCVRIEGLYPYHYRRIEVFLARHVQAEQQEAELWHCKSCRIESGGDGECPACDKPFEVGDLPPKQAQGAQAGDEAEPAVSFAAWLIDHREGQAVTEEEMQGWLAEWHETRAALATQPAAGEPVAWQERASFRVARDASENGRHDFESAPSAAAHGDEAVRKIRGAFPLLDEAGLDPEAHCCECNIQQERKRLHRFLDAAMHTQGDREKQDG